MCDQPLHHPEVEDAVPRAKEAPLHKKVEPLQQNGRAKTDHRTPESVPRTELGRQRQTGAYCPSERGSHSGSDSASHFWRFAARTFARNNARSVMESAFGNSVSRRRQKSNVQNCGPKFAQTVNFLKILFSAVISCHAAKAGERTDGS
jgi:hypothetical protein